MTSLDTIIAITENLKSVLCKQGLRFSIKTYDAPDSIPASLLPLGEIFYKGEAFEYTHGQRPGYIEAEFLLRVVLRCRSPEDATREEERWVHGIKDAISVNALNTGALSLTKYVSRVTLKAVEAENKNGFSVASIGIAIRYRES